MKRLVARLRLLLVGLVSVFAASSAVGHEPFDFSSRLMVYPDRMEMVSTLGTDGVSRLLSAGGVSPEQIAESLRPRGPDLPVEHPVAVATQVFRLTCDGAPLTARKVRTVSEGAEILLTLVYDRPASGSLDIHAAAYETAKDLRDGALIVEDESAGHLGAAILSMDNTVLSVTLPSIQTSLTSTRPGETPPAAGELIQNGKVTQSSSQSRQRYGLLAIGVAALLLGGGWLLKRGRKRV